MWWTMPARISARWRGWTINITTTQPVCNTQSCTITAPTSVTIPPGTCGTVVNYSPAVTFTGQCGVVVGPNPPSGSFFGIGTTTVLVRGTRADASFTDASFPVTVQDSETQATGLGASVTNNYCNTTVTYTAVTGAGSTTVVDAPQQTLPPPYVHCTSCPELNITTTASFTAPVTTCITMPASTPLNTFRQLRILHGEPGLVNRTFNANFGSKTICARTNTVSPFVVALDPNAPTAGAGDNQRPDHNRRRFAVGRCLDEPERSPNREGHYGRGRQLPLRKRGW